LLFFADEVEKTGELTMAHTASSILVTLQIGSCLTA